MLADDALAVAAFWDQAPNVKKKIFFVEICGKTSWRTQPVGLNQ